MKKYFTTISFLILSLLTAFSLFPIAGAESSVKNGDKISFGTYPQALVTDEKELAGISSAISREKFTAECKSLDCWHGSGDFSKSSQEQYDYMFYLDVQVDDTKYRGILFSEYRPKYTYGSTDYSSGNQYSHGYFTATVYWFRFEPVEWTVIDSETGFAISDKVLDCQAFAADGDTSSPGILKWVDSDFCKAAFDERAALRIIGNEDGSRVSLPSSDLLEDKSLGFNTDTLPCSPTDYAVCLGTEGEAGSPTVYWTGSKSTKGNGRSVTKAGVIKVSDPEINYGVRPVIHIDFTEYTVTFLDGDKIISNKSLFFGDKITPPDVERQGYDFDGWDGKIPDGMPDENLTFTALWKARTDTPYTVTEYTQNIDGTSYSKSSAILYGTTDSEISIKPDEKHGFAVNPEKSNLSSVIFADGSTALEIYYDRVKSTVIFDDGKGNKTEKEYLFGETIILPPAPLKPGYSFVKWDIDSTVAGTENITVFPLWEKKNYSVTYTVFGKTFAGYSVPYGDIIPVPEEPDYEGYIFTGWDKEIPPVQPDEALTFRGIFKTCSVEIAGYREKRYTPYKAQITFTSTGKNTDETELVWYVNGKEYSIGESCTVAAASDSYEIVVKAVRNGKVICSSKAEYIQIKKGFFDIILSFFGRLFKSRKYFVIQK